MKRSLAFLLILAASSTLAWESELAPFLEVRPDVERERRYVRFSCEIPSSDMEMPKEPLDIFGLSFGLCFDCVPGRMAGLQWGSLVAEAASATGLQGSFGLTSACESDGIQLGLLVAGSENHAHDCRGLQAALFYNRADKLHGVQIGFVNVAHAGSGVQIGFFNLFGSDDDLLMIPFLNARF